MTPRQRYCAAKVLPNLTSLRLHLEVNLLDDFIDELYSERVIGRTLSAASNLTSLVTELKEEEDRDPLTNFKMILEGCKMPRLVNFGLRSLAFTEAGMETFLQHSKGIRHMSLMNVKMTSGSWRSMFHNIKSSLALETVELKRLHGISV